MFYDDPIAIETYDHLIAPLAAGAGSVGDLAFYTSLAANKNLRVLDIGSGSGRVSFPLALTGCTVVGIDVSAGMTAQAKKLSSSVHPHIAGRVSFLQGSMEDFSIEERFDLAVIPGRSFQHLTTPQAQQRALVNIRRHLVDGGMLAFDIAQPPYDDLFARNWPANIRTVHDPVSGLTYKRRRISRSSDVFGQTFSDTYELRVCDSHGHTLRSTITSFTLKWSSRHELVHLFGAAGFSVVDEFSDFARSPAGYAKDQIWVLRSSLAPVSLSY